MNNKKDGMGALGKLTVPDFFKVQSLLDVAVCPWQRDRACPAADSE